MTSAPAQMLCGTVSPSRTAILDSGQIVASPMNAPHQIAALYIVAGSLVNHQIGAISTAHPGKYPAPCIAPTPSMPAK